MPSPKQKLYCYVDETGQDTKGDFFIVSVIISAEDQEEIAQLICNSETESGKGRFKWGRAEIKQRVEFIKGILKHSQGKIAIYYSLYRNTTEYKTSTVLTIAKSINTIKDYSEHIFNIYVDGLSKKDERYYGSQLHHLGIHTKKVKGVKKDENNPMIRLADSMCGFIRDVIEEKTEDTQKIFDKAQKDKVLTEV